MRKPVTAIDTVGTDRPFLTIDGEAHDLAVHDDFGPGQVRLVQLIGEARDLARELGGRGDDLSADEIERFDALLARVVSQVLRAPADVVARLSASQKLEVIAAFTLTANTRVGRPTGFMSRLRAAFGG